MSTVLGHGARRIARIEGRLVGRALTADEPGALALVVGEDAEGPFAAEVAGEALPSTPLGLGAWRVVDVGGATPRWLDPAEASMRLLAHRASSARAFHGELGALVPTLVAAAAHRAAEQADQDADFRVAELVALARATLLALEAASSAGTDAALASALLGVIEIAPRLDALALELAPWNAEPAALVEAGRALATRAALDLPAAWLRATVTRSVLAR